VHRARDYKSKRERLKKLKEKIAFRNKDEFYWGMVKGKTERGVHIQSRGNEALPVDVVRILKTQDANYIRTLVSAEENKINAIKEQLHSLADLIPGSSASAGGDATASDLEFLSEPENDDIDLDALRKAGVIPDDKLTATSFNGSDKKGKGKQVLKGTVPGRGHTIFTDDQQEFLSYQPTRTQELSTSPTATTAPSPAPLLDLGYKDPKPSRKGKSVQKQQDEAEVARDQREIEMDEQEQELEKEARQHRLTLLTELSARLNRLSQLRAVEGHMTQQRAMMGKGSKVVKRVAEKIVEGESDDELGGSGSQGRKVSWRPKVIKWKAERKR